jgi:hypothetical protein
MGNRFRASLGHRGCVLAVATVVVFLVPVTAAGQVREDAATNSSCTKSDTLSKRVDFADLHRAQKTLGHKYRWARQLSEFEMGARQRTAEPTTLKEFLDFAAGAARSWTAVEKANWQILVDKSSDALKGLNVHVPNIDLITTSGEEEFGAAYTRWRKKCFTFCRETDPLLRDDLYALLGFKTVDGFEYPAELEDRRISNRAAFEYLHTVTVQSGSGSVDVMPVIQSLLPLDEVIQLRISSTRWTSFCCPLMPTPAKLSATPTAI